MHTNPGPQTPIEWVPASGIIGWVGIGKETLKKWRANGRIIYKKLNGICMYNKTDLLRRLEEGDNIA
ncbi:MAG: hypothetical protein ABIY51_09060 [Ferruginibacter sp.]